MGDPEPGPSSTTLPVPSTSCYICQNPGGNLVQQPQISSFELFIQSVTSRALYGDQQAITVKGRLGDATADVLMRNHVKWHRDCYKDMTHKVHIERLNSRYEEALRVGEAPKQGIKGRPMTRTHTASGRLMQTRLCKQQIEICANGTTVPCRDAFTQRE